jgi:hypothetical protein
MKKKACVVCFITACLLCGGTFFAFADPGSSYDGEISLNGTYIHHGRKEGGASEKMRIEVERSLPNGAIYGGINSASMFEDGGIIFFAGESITSQQDNSIRVKAGSFNQIAPEAGFFYDFFGSFCADVGYAAHFYTNLKTTSQFLEVLYGNKCEKFSSEVYAGLAADVIFSPRIYVSYDINLKELDICASGAYAYDLGRLGLDCLVVEGGLHVGFDSTENPFCINKFFELPDLGYGMRKHYTYYGGELALCYRHSPNLTFRLSGHYNGNSAPKDSWPNGHIGAEISETNFTFDLGDKNKNVVWFSAAMAFSF